jgi:integrase
MYRGRPCAVWTDARGKAQRAPLNAAGTEIIQEAEIYSCMYFDEHGKRRKRTTGCKDRKTAQEVANKIELDANLRKRGHIDSKAERYAKEARRPINEHVADFRAFLTDKGNTAKHVDMTCKHVETIIESCAAESIGDLTGAGVMAAIGDLRDDGKSLRTCNGYLTSAKAFTKWLRNERRTPDDALTALAGFNADTDRRYIRREMTPEELAYFLATVEDYTTPMHNLPGPDRMMAYIVALGTGFRSLELRSLTPESFDLDSDPPTVTVQAAYSKRRRLDVQPIRRDLADSLRPWLVDYERDERPFANLPGATARMLRDDLEEARRRWLDEAKTDNQRKERAESDFLQHTDAAGRVADFHGLTARLHLGYRGRRGIGQDGSRTGSAFYPRLDYRPIFPCSATRSDGSAGRPARSAAPGIPRIGQPSPAATGTDGGGDLKMAAYRQQYSNESTR